MMTLFYSKTFTPESRLVKTVESRLSYQSEAQTRFHLGSAVENVCNVFSGKADFANLSGQDLPDLQKLFTAQGKQVLQAHRKGQPWRGRYETKGVADSPVLCSAPSSSIKVQAKGTEKVPLCCGNWLCEEAPSGPRMTNTLILHDSNLPEST
jgi:hypothetical protein